VCGHPWLVGGTPFNEPDAAYYRRLINECGKLRLLDRMLTKFKERGHRVIIFSQFTIVVGLYNKLNPVYP
jgi:SNF2 family DNA or RNA helicase